MPNVAHEMVGLELKLGVVSIFFYEMLNTGLGRWNGGVRIEEWDLLHFFMEITKFLPATDATTFYRES